MRKPIAIGLALALCCLRCAGESPAHRATLEHEAKQRRILAADRLEKILAASPLASWDVSVRAAGDDCAVLLLYMNRMVGEDAIVGSLLRGDNAYDFLTGGVSRYARLHEFRGIAIMDSDATAWVSGDARRRTDPSGGDRAAWYVYGFEQLTPRHKDRLLGRMSTCP